ncbi:MAG: SRPBCC family protein [Ferruginibacter sp.]
MAIQEKTVLTVTTTVNAPIEKVWEFWTNPEHISKWNTASDEWHTPTATNDLRVGGSFSSRMEAKDGSMGFDFGGVYDEVRNHEYIEYTLGDARKVKITFTEQGNSTNISESFEAETKNPVELQQAGWQAIMNNFKKYTEENQ